jgi:hypothetical protein
MVTNFNEYIHLQDLYLLIWNMHYNVSTMCGNIAGNNFLKVLLILSYDSECCMWLKMIHMWGFQSQEHGKITHVLVVGMKWIFLCFGNHLLIKYHFTKSSLWESAFYPDTKFSCWFKIFGLFDQMNCS